MMPKFECNGLSTGIMVKKNIENLKLAEKTNKIIKIQILNLSESQIGLEYLDTAC